VVPEGGSHKAVPTRGSLREGSLKGGPPRGIIQRGPHKGGSHRRGTRGDNGLTQMGSHKDGLTRGFPHGSTANQVPQGGPPRVVP
jgi:hypothetical protein